MVSCMSKQVLIAELLFGNVGVQQSPYEPVDMSLNTGFGSKFQQFPIEFLKPFLLKMLATNSRIWVDNIFHQMYIKCEP